MNARFAPSPTGYMHLGNLSAALMSWLDARRRNLNWLVRIEDIDARRCRKAYEDAIIEDLAWLGLVPDAPPVRQSERGTFYRDALERLDSLGLTYKCFCSRKELLAIDAPQDGSGSSGVLAHRAVCRPKAGASPSVRLLAPDETDTFTDLRFGSQSARICDAAGDVVLLRADGLWGYQLASTVDDALQEISLVTRGADLIPSAHVQRFILKSLGLNPPEYAHIPLVMADGIRMAKRNGEKATLRYFRDELHFSRGKILALAARSLGLVPAAAESVTLDFLLSSPFPERDSNPSD